MSAMIALMLVEDEASRPRISKRLLAGHEDDEAGRDEIEAGGLSCQPSPSSRIGEMEDREIEQGGDDRAEDLVIVIL